MKMQDRITKNINDTAGKKLEDIINGSINDLKSQMNKAEEEISGRLLEMANSLKMIGISSPVFRVSLVRIAIVFSIKDMDESGLDEKQIRGLLYSVIDEAFIVSKAIKGPHSKV